MNSYASSYSRQRGVTLLENMVALLILSVGMLGLAGLQVYSLRGSAGASYRQIAVQQAQDMADRIRANPAAVFPAPGGVVQYNGMTASAAYDNPATVFALITDCRVSTCTPNEMVAFDVTEWQVANNAQLPGDHSKAGGYITSVGLTGLVSGVAGAPLNVAGLNTPQRQRYTITIRWDGDRSNGPVGADPSNCALAAVTELNCYSLVIDL